MTFRLFWRDTRIVPNVQHLIYSDPIGTYANINPDTVEDIWFPDIFVGEVISLRTPKYVREAASLRLLQNFFTSSPYFPLQALHR